jgi:hypothetical protein
MRNRLVIVFAAAAGLSMSVPLVAHHTGSTLYTEKTTTVKGIVASWLWSNPHCLLRLDVKGEDGQVVQWIAELQAPNTIYLEGYRANTFKVGDEVTLTLRPVAGGQPYGQLAQSVLANGTKLGTLPGARGRGAAAP